MKFLLSLALLLQLDGGLFDGVRQLWEASKDEGGSWTMLFDGLYIKVPESQ